MAVLIQDAIAQDDLACPRQGLAAAAEIERDLIITNRQRQGKTENVALGLAVDFRLVGTVR